MKKNNEILKYLADLMGEKEKEEFEKKLLESSDLAGKLDKFKEISNDMKSIENDTADSIYFTNLLPRVRAKISKQKKTRFIFNPAYLIPLTVIILFLVLYPFKREDSTSMENKILSMNDSSKNEILNVLNENFNLVYVENEPEISEIIETVITEELNENEMISRDSKYVDTDDLLNNLQNQELEDIYNEMMDKKIL